MAGDRLAWPGYNTVMRRWLFNIAAAVSGVLWSIIDLFVLVALAASISRIDSRDGTGV